MQEWVIVSPNRLNRPWSGAVFNENKERDEIVEDICLNNPLAPGSMRANGQTNINYSSTYTFENDFPALASGCSPSIDATLSGDLLDPLFAWAPATGSCQVMCYHPRSDVTLALMEQSNVVDVISEWCRITRECTKMGHQWVQIFENRGVMMGCSNPHPHCQIWASDFVPTLATRCDKGQKEYSKRFSGHVLLLDYVKRELDCLSKAIIDQQPGSPSSDVDVPQHRIVLSNDDWVCLVVWWAVWPYEVMLLPRCRHILRLDQLTPAEITSLASIMSSLLIAYDNLFMTSFPYCFGWYQAPLQIKESLLGHWQLHAIFCPPLLRSATIRKFMVGYELFAETQRDLTPESAAKHLRSSIGPHYSCRRKLAYL